MKLFNYEIKGEYLTIRLFRGLSAFINLLASLIAKFDQENVAFKIFEKRDFWLLRKHYYLPIPDEVDQSYEKNTTLPGIKIEDKVCLSLIDSLVTPYKPEFDKLPLHKSDKNKFYLINGTFMAVDAHIFYGMIRKLSPQIIMEIGSGNSTLLALEAIKQNKRKPKLICVEPYPPQYLTKLPGIKLIKQRVQDIPLTEFEILKAGDIVFIDSTHVLKPGGDVWWLFCEVLPRLKKGVYVHIHDIALPEPYPAIYRDYHWYWTEQYVLQTFLAFNSRFQILWPGNYLMKKYPTKLKKMFNPAYDEMRKVFPNSGPGSFWMKVV